MQPPESLTIETNRLTHTHAWQKKELPFLALAAVFLCLSLWADWGNFERVVIRSDGTGYYEYLPAFLKYGDPWLEEIRQRRTHEIDATVTWNLVSVPSHRYVIKYPMGVALLWLPFYLVADSYCHFFGVHEATGYSIPYQMAVCAAAIFYLLLGMRLLFCLLQKHFSPVVIMVSGFAIVFGTNLFHYATFDACFSHVYSFFAITLWIYLLDRFFQKPTYAAAAMLGATIGLVFLIRYTNLIVGLFLPAYWLRYRPMGKAFWIKLMVAAGVAFVTVLPQFFYYYWGTGKLVFSPYMLRGEHFTYWQDPQLLYVLFSVQAGFLLWSPAAGFGLVQFARQSWWGPAREFSVAAIVVFSLQWYLIASWSLPDYGAGFGHRGFVDLLPLMMIGLTAMYGGMMENRLLMGLVTAILLLLTIYSWVLMLGYWNGIVPFSAPSWSQWYDALTHYLARSGQ